MTGEKRLGGIPYFLIIGARRKKILDKKDYSTNDSLLEWLRTAKDEINEKLNFIIDFSREEWIEFLEKNLKDMKGEEWYLAELTAPLIAKSITIKLCKEEIINFFQEEVKTLENLCLGENLKELEKIKFLLENLVKWESSIAEGIEKLKKVEKLLIESSFTRELERELELQICKMRLIDSNFQLDKLYKENLFLKERSKEKTTQEELEILVKENKIFQRKISEALVVPKSPTYDNFNLINKKIIGSEVLAEKFNEITSRIIKFLENEKANEELISKEEVALFIQDFVAVRLSKWELENINKTSEEKARSQKELREKLQEEVFVFLNKKINDGAWRKLEEIKKHSRESFNTDHGDLMKSVESSLPPFFALNLSFDSQNKFDEKEIEDTSKALIIKKD